LVNKFIQKLGINEKLVKKDNESNSSNYSNPDGYLNNENSDIPILQQQMIDRNRRLLEEENGVRFKVVKDPE
jgi:hypothetical protein